MLQRPENSNDRNPSHRFLVRFGEYQRHAVNVAACFAVVLRTEANVPASLDKVHSGGRKVGRQYSTGRAWDDLAQVVLHG